MSEVMIIHPVSALLWGVAITILILGGVLYFYRGTRRDNLNEKMLYFGIGSLIVSVGFQRLFFYLGDLYFPGFYVDHTYYGNIDILDLNYQFFKRMGYVVFPIGLTILTFSFEMNLKKTKYVITIFNIILIILILALPFDLARTISILFTFISFIYVLLTMYFFTKLSRLTTKNVSAFMVSGFILFIIGSSLYGIDIKVLNIVPLEFPPILFIIAVFVFIIPLSISPQKYKQVLTFWISVGILNLGIFVYLLLIFGIYGLPLDLLFMCIFVLTVFAITFFLTIKDITSYNSKVNKELPNILEMFTKPQKITEEEVSISKEKKICLVCKGELSRKMYMCPECNAFYCENCSNTLVSLENVCWACNTPIEPLRPVKLYIEEGEKAAVGIKTHKKGKKK